MTILQTRNWELEKIIDNLKIQNAELPYYREKLEYYTEQIESKNNEINNLNNLLE